MPEQPSLPFPLRSTPASDRGDTRVWQHAWCGTLVAVVGSPEWATGGACKPRKPGPCPNVDCERPGQDWWEQRLPVGVFGKPEVVS